MHRILENKLENFLNDKYLVHIHSQAKSGGIKLLEVHGIEKSLNPNLRPEKQHTFPNKGNLERPHIGQGRARSKRKKGDPINQAINRPSHLSQEIPGRTKVETRKTNSVHTTNNTVNNNPFIPDIPFHPDLLLRPKHPIKQNLTPEQNSQNEQNINPNINFDFEENPPFQEGVMSETFQRPDKSFFQNSKELGDIVVKGNFIHKYLPKQMNIDKMLEVIQRKVLKGTHLPMEIKEIQAGYLCSPYFKDLYSYLSQNKIPSLKSAVKKLEALAERYVLLDSLLFKISLEK